MKLLFALFFFLPTWANSTENNEALPIYIFELRPLIYKEGNAIKGAWHESFERLAQISNLKFTYQIVSVSRLELLLASQQPGCNLTLLKTKTRMVDKKINFVFDHKIKTILKTYQRANDSRRLDLQELKQDKSLEIATNTPVVLDILKENNIDAKIYPKLNSVINMLVSKRIDVFAGSNLAIEEMDEYKTGKIRAGIVLKSLTHGVACSPGTSPEVIEKLKKASKHWQL